MNIVKKLEEFVSRVFKTTLEVFFESLKLSPNAQGYISGSITELLLKKKLEQQGLIVKRIKEKWQGQKHHRHCGDFYIKHKESWFVLESKGIKSNSEKWHKLYNYEKLKSFLFTYRDKIHWIDQSEVAEQQIDQWIKAYLPKFFNDYQETLYDYEEIIKYKVSQKKTKKSEAIEKLKGYSREEMAQIIDERLEYLTNQIQVLETHLVSGTGGSNKRTQATPRKDEFNLLSVDIFLKYQEHKFLFANPQNLESSGVDSNHLQQNYVIGFVFQGNNLCLFDEWSGNFDEVLDTVQLSDAIKEEDMQIDTRNVVYENE